MIELSALKEAFSRDTVPAGANAKKFEKLLKKYEHIVNPMFVHLYPVRDGRYEDAIAAAYGRCDSRRSGNVGRRCRLSTIPCQTIGQRTPRSQRAVWQLF